MSLNVKAHIENEKAIQFSVLISVYKKEKPEYLKTALQSIINQTLKPTEIVIVKDGLLTQELDDCIKNMKINILNLQR